MPESRTKCPACGRSAAVLSRKVDGTYRGLTLRDGSQLYSCGYEDCHIDIFQSHDDAATPYQAKEVVGHPSIWHCLHHFHEVLGMVHDVAEKLGHPDDSRKTAASRERAVGILEAGRIQVLRELVDHLEANLRGVAKNG